MEDHLWSDTERGGDIWNGRWASGLLLLVPTGYKVSSADYKAGVKWLQKLTLILQKAQRAIYTARHTELLSKEAKERRERLEALKTRWKRRRSQTLYEAWRLPYFKPSCPRRRFLVTPTALEIGTPTVQQKWLQYTKSIKSAATQLCTPAPTVHKPKPPCQHSTREQHRTAKLKLQKLRNIILLCR